MIYYSDMDEDIREITNKISELGYYFDNPKEVATLWKEYSNGVCAQWLVVYDMTLRHFAEWLKENKEIEYL